MARATRRVVAMTALVALLGAGIAVGLLLVAQGWRPSAEPSVRHALIAVDSQSRRRLARAAALGAVVLVLTRWPVAAIASGLLGWFSQDLLGSRAAREAGVARTEAIATWTEMLRDTIAAAHGLE